MFVIESRFSVAPLMASLIVNIGHVRGLFWRGGEADLGGAGELVKNFLPGGIRRSAAAVAFVHHDQIKEIPGEFSIQFLVVFRPL